MIIAKNLKFKGKKYLTLLCLFCYFLLLPLYLNVQAHILKTNGSIGAVLHIDPQDDPVAGQQASLFFEFKDTQNKFDPKICNCVFSILQTGTLIYSQPLFQSNSQPSLTNASVFYTFPGKAVYQVKVAGTPIPPNDFQPFSLIYDVRVDKVAGSTTASDTQAPTYANWALKHLILIIIFGILGFFIVSVIIKQLLIKK